MCRPTENRALAPPPGATQELAASATIANPHLWDGGRDPCVYTAYVELRSGTQVTDAGLVHFKNCKNFTNIYLNGTKVSDAGLANFKDCKNLTYLTLGGFQISNAGLAHFKDCTNLNHFALYNDTLVNDAGLSQLWPTLRIARICRSLICAKLR